MKALFYQQGLTSVISHSVLDLLLDISGFFPDLAQLEEQARFLDSFYLPTRYPNALTSERAPADYYSKAEAERCLSYAESIVTAVKDVTHGQI